MTDVAPDPRYGSALERLEERRRVADIGTEYWFAREIMDVFGYVEWRNFTGAVDRARTSLVTNNVPPSQHIVETNRMVEIGSGSHRSVPDFFLSRGACYLIAMNGDTTKPEIAAAQAYFAVTARENETKSRPTEDELRLEMREKVKNSHKVVSGVAQEAGVTGPKQALFHDARYKGLYKMSRRDVMSKKGIGPMENPFDRMSALELSANDFQMNLAARVIPEERVKGEAAAIKKNEEIAKHVRETMIQSGSVPPEQLPPAEPIKEVVKRLKSQEKSKKVL